MCSLSVFLAVRIVTILRSCMGASMKTATYMYTKGSESKQQAMT